MSLVITSSHFTSNKPTSKSTKTNTNIRTEKPSCDCVVCCKTESSSSLLSETWEVTIWSTRFHKTHTSNSFFTLSNTLHPPSTASWSAASPPPTTPLKSPMPSLYSTLKSLFFLNWRSLSFWLVHLFLSLSLRVLSLFFLIQFWPKIVIC